MVKISHSPSKSKKIQLNFTAREGSDSCDLLIKNKIRLDNLEKFTGISKIEIVDSALDDYEFYVNILSLYNDIDKEKIGLKANDNLLFHKMMRPIIITHLDKLLRNHLKMSKEESSFDAEDDFKIRGLDKVNEIVSEMMVANDSALNWWHKIEINPRSIRNWIQRYNKPYKSINNDVLKTYFKVNRIKVDEHHQHHDIQTNHNRRAVERERALKKTGDI